MMSAFSVVAIVLVSPVILILLFLYRAKRLNIPPEFNYTEKPSLVRLYTKAFLVSFSRKQGVLAELPGSLAGKTTESTISDEGCAVTASNCRFSKDKVAKYAGVCGYGADVMAAFPCYIETYFMPLLICVAASPKFRLSPLGLIHVRQKMNVFADLESLLTGPCTLECRADSYTETGKGFEVSMLMKAFNEGQVCVWDGEATLLSRSPHKQVVSSNQTRSQPAPPPADKAETQQSYTVEEWMPGDLGVRYARVAGDWNPHHLWRWSARFLGYNKPIAHGMCTVAKSLALIHKQGTLSCDQPFKLAVEFKRPAFLPGTSLFMWEDPADSGSLPLHVVEKFSKAPQLIGHISAS